ncbi:hypothetical protein H3C66_03905 [Patescibacteria group bacterium]|nr:hypothetical protein [Patescibacteria group bacterium]
MPYLSAEYIGTIFTMHGYSLERSANETVYEQMKKLCESGTLTEHILAQHQKHSALDTFGMLKHHITQQESGSISDEALFQLFDLLDFVAEMVDEEGMNLNPTQVFLFLRHSFSSDPTA